MNELISSDSFFKDLESGILSALAAKVRADDTLMLAFRKNSLNVYYRGGSILRLSCKNEIGSYTAHFDPNYAKGSPNILPQLPPIITAEIHCEAWLRSLPTLKEIMNGFLQHTKNLNASFNSWLRGKITGLLFPTRPNISSRTLNMRTRSRRSNRYVGAKMAEHGSEEWPPLYTCLHRNEVWHWRL
jgi:hypothetical protein